MSIPNWHEMIIEFETKEISNKQIIAICELFCDTFRIPFNKMDILKQIASKFTEIANTYNDKYHTSIRLFDGFGLTLININPEFNIKKQQISIKFSREITEEGFNKYIEFVSKLPSTAKVYADYYDGILDDMRDFTVFPKKEVEEYDEKCLLNFKDAYRIEKFANGSVMVWLGRPFDINSYDKGHIFGRSIQKQKDAFKKHLELCNIQVRK